GRMNVLVEGHGRFRLMRLTEGRSFRTAEVEPIEDDGEPATRAEGEHGRGIFRALGGVAEAEETEEPKAGPPALSYELAARVDFGHELKQELLELRSERRRLHRLRGLGG